MAKTLRRHPRTYPFPRPLTRKSLYQVYTKKGRFLIAYLPYIPSAITKTSYLITSTPKGDIHMFQGQRQVTFMLVKGASTPAAALNHGNTLEPKVPREARVTKRKTSSEMKRTRRDKRKHPLLNPQPTLSRTQLIPATKFTNPHQNTTPLSMRHLPITRKYKTSTQNLFLLPRGVSQSGDSILSSPKGLGWWQHPFSSKVTRWVVPS